MYLIGADHPNKETATKIIERLIHQGERLVTDAEVFQEILHRYYAIHRLEFIEPAFDLLRRLVDEVYAIDIATVELARTILLRSPELSARDAIHVAAMKANGVDQMVTFDEDFDRIAGISRITI